MIKPEELDPFRPFMDAAIKKFVDEMNASDHDLNVEMAKQSEWFRKANYAMVRGMIKSAGYSDADTREVDGDNPFVLPLDGILYNNFAVLLAGILMGVEMARLKTEADSDQRKT